MGKRTVKNYPSPRLMKTIGATNLSTAEAIGELVANCFDARYKKEKLTITICFEDEKIIVIDNGKGMTSNILEKAVCIAEDMANHLERIEGAKGHFGMGFKTACATLGGFYEIFTRPVEEKREYHVEFDIDEYSQRPTDEDAWDVIIEDSESFKNSPLGSAKHGTAFIISRIKDEDISKDAIKKYLGNAFKGHIDTGDTIKLIDGDRTYIAEPEEYEWIPGTRIEINEDFANYIGYPIKGWMALSTITHNDGSYGFNIFRNNQLVEIWNKDWISSKHLMTSRIIGEFDISRIDPTFYKQGLQKSFVWRELKQTMSVFIAPLLKASREINRKGNVNNPEKVKEIVTNLHNDYKYGIGCSDCINIEEPSPIEDFSTEKEDDKRSSISEKVKYASKNDGLLLSDGKCINITYLEKASNNVNSPFDYIYDEGDFEANENAELQVIIYTDHPLWDKKYSKIYKSLATGDAIYRMLTDKEGYKPAEALELRNEWLWKNNME